LHRLKPLNEENLKIIIGKKNTKVAKIHEKFEKADKKMRKLKQNGSMGLKDQ